MSKKLYNVLDKHRDAVGISADFYQTCTSTGVSTFYVECEDTTKFSPELVATFDNPVSIVESLSAKFPVKVNAEEKQ